MARFKALTEQSKAGEAQIELAWCYWRAGAFDEARVLLRATLDSADALDDELRTVALLRSAEVPRGPGHQRGIRRNKWHLAHANAGIEHVIGRAVIGPARNDAGAPIISTDASLVCVRVMSTNEELMIARHTQRVLQAGQPGA